MKNNPIFQLVNYLFKWILWIDLFEEMWKEYNEGSNSPEWARVAVWNLIWWEDSDKLGSLSEHFESGWAWSRAINPRDWKWPSFWTYQLHEDFLRQFAQSMWIKGDHTKPWKDTDFAKNWLAEVEKINKRDWEWAFKQKEHDFIKKTHFNPQMDKISKSWVNTSNFSMSLKNIIWSTSVQFWPNTDVVNDSIKNLWVLNYNDLSNQKRLIEEICRVRTLRHKADSNRYEKEKSISLHNLSINLSDNDDSWVNVPRWIVSFPAERSDKWTTLCSRTAYKNLTQTFWISLDPNKSKWDANTIRDNYKATWELNTNFPSTNWNVAELFCKSLKFPQYWHRAVAFKDNWIWYVLDPYLKVTGWKTTRDPIPWNTYRSFLDRVGRTFYWAKTY
jgi:hypothetical protein